MAELHKIAAVSGRVFKRLPRMGEFRADLKLAGIADKDERGRWVMFHSLRHTLNASLAQAGVDRTSRMLLMRHSDARLTDCTYLDHAMVKLAGLTDSLPDWNVSQKYTHGPVISGHNGSQPDTHGVLVGESQAMNREGVRRGLTQEGMDGEKLGALGFEPRTKGL